MHDQPDQPHEPRPPADRRLTDRDAQALDELLALARHDDVNRLADTPLAQRSSEHGAIARLLDLLRNCPAEEPHGNLAQRTVAKLDTRSHADHDVEVLASLATQTGGGFRWAELLATAASVLIAFSLLWPALDFSRAEARRVTCATHLAATGSALAGYAADHDGALPRGRTRTGVDWWQVGSAPAGSQDVVRSNSAHLYLLVREAFLNADTLNCPDNPQAIAGLAADRHDWPNAAAVSYSYQNQYTPQVHRLAVIGAMPVLADKNPLFAIRQDRRGIEYASHLPRTASSRFHRRGGQNVLAATGSVNWMRDPVVRRSGAALGRTPALHDDNIWLVNGIDQYRGNEAPADPHDAFLVP